MLLTLTKAASLVSSGPVAMFTLANPVQALHCQTTGSDCAVAVYVALLAKNNCGKQ
jgi:hypothetical protein